jgi:hypothetical protein
LRDESAVPVPQTETNGQDLREEWEEKRGDDDRDRIVLDDAGGQQNRARCCAGDVAGGDVSQLPEILNDIREWFVRRQSKAGQRFVVDDGPHLAGSQRKI